MGSRNLFAAVLLCVAASASADVDPSLFQDLHWRTIGPFRAGRVLAVAGVPGDAKHFYFGSVNGGVWETGDAGRTWQPIFDAQTVGSIGAIAIAATDANVIYAGSGEADMRSDIAQGDGVYKSTDAGKTWAHVGLADTQQVGRILVDPRDANVVFVAALGHPYGPNAERGVFRSRDGGRTWHKVLFKNADTGAIDLAFQPGNPDVIYASLWQTRRPPWSVYPPSNGPGGGLYKSSDGGATWTQVVGHGFPDRVGHVGLALSDAAPQRVYAMIDGDTILTPKLRAVYFSEKIEDYAVSNSTGDMIAIDGFDEEQFRLSLGAEIARSFTVESGSVLTPKLGVTAGFSGLDGSGAFGSLTAGLSIQTVDLWMIDASLLLNVEGDGETSAGARVGAAKRF